MKRVPYLPFPNDFVRSLRIYRKNNCYKFLYYNNDLNCFFICENKMRHFHLFGGSLELIHSK